MRKTKTKQNPAGVALSENRNRKPEPVTGSRCDGPPRERPSRSLADFPRALRVQAASIFSTLFSSPIFPSNPRCADSIHLARSASHADVSGYQLRLNDRWINRPHRTYNVHTHSHTNYESTVYSQLYRFLFSTSSNSMKNVELLSALMFVAVYTRGVVFI